MLKYGYYNDRFKLVKMEAYSFLIVVVITSGGNTLLQIGSEL